MNRRFKWTGLALVTMLLAYALYAVAAVPLIEPRPTTRTTSDGPNSSPQVKSLAHLFPPGSWELGRPKILDTEQGMLLFDDYEPMKDRRKLRLTRCSLIRYVKSKDSEGQAGARKGNGKGRPIILRSMSGAELTFDRELNITRGEFGDLVSGQLEGEVAIYSPASEPAANDAFSLKTRNVQVDTHHIWTPHAVEFTYGPNSGSGKDLRIEWSQLEPEADSDKDEEQASLGHLRSLELVHLDKMVLNLPADDLLDVGGPDSSETDARRTAATQTVTDTEVAPTPVEVTCDGPCRINFLVQVASLEDNVRIHRHASDGPSAYMLCDLLEVFFGGDPDKGDETKAEGDDLPAMQLRRLVANGSPVMIRVPSRAVEVRAERLEYDFQERRIWIEDKKKVQLQDSRFRIEAKELDYAMGEKGKIGRLWALGPGHVWGTKDGRDFEAEWSRELRLKPHEGNQLLSLNGAAYAVVSETGRFSAEEVHVFFWEVPRPNAPDKYDLVPDRMKASGRVVVDSPKFSAQVRDANLWFREPTPDTQEATADSSPVGRSQTAGNRAKPPGDSQDRVILVADLLHAQLIRGDEMRLERLNVQGGIDFQQVQGPDKPPVVIRGERFELEHAHTDHAVGVLTGRPASVTAEGMQMTGPTLRLLRDENTVQIDGPGNLTLPPQKTTGIQLPPFQVSWEGGMHFDGRHARFHQQISTRGSHQTEKGDILDMVGSADSLVVSLNQYVDFNDAKVNREIGVREFRFDKNVRFDSQLYDQYGQQKLFQQMQVPNLVINQQTGQLSADGPGWVRGVHPRNQLQFHNTAVNSRPTSDGTQLDFIRVDFANQMQGHIEARQIEFGEHVTTIYGPVERWDQVIDPHQPAEWSKDTITMNCRQLAVADMGSGSGELDNVVLEAKDNAFVKGKTFSAAGQRISYTRIKDQLVLEGDGRNEAVLSYQPQPGAKPTELKGGKILFWPGIPQFELNDVRSLDIQDPHQFRRSGR